MSIPLWGDFAALRVRHLARLGVPVPDVLAGGTPCQSFSVAGRRRGLDDSRGNLSLDFVRLADAIDAFRSRRNLPGLIVCWENVPGILWQSPNPFGVFLGALSGHGAPLVSPVRGKWPYAGMVHGPARAVAWRCVDAQYFGLAQRRLRLFVVGCPGSAGIDPAEVLFERQVLHRDPPSRHQAREVSSLAPTLESRAGSGSAGSDAILNGAGIVDVAPTLPARSHGRGIGDFETGGGIVGEPEPTAYDPNQMTSQTNRSNPAPGRCHTLPASAQPPIIVNRAAVCGDRTHALTADGHDASEDGSGRGTPSRSGHPAVAFSTRSNSVDPGIEISPTMTAKGFGHTAVGVPTAPADDLAVVDPQQIAGACHGAACQAGRDVVSPTLTQRNPIAIAFGSRDSGAPPAVAIGFKGSNPEIGDVSPTLTGHHRGGVAAFSWSTRDAAPSPTTAPPLTGRQNNLAVALRGRAGGAAAEVSETAPALRAGGGGGSSKAMITDGYRVRRLTPRECERLMGMPDTQFSATISVCFAPPPSLAPADDRNRRSPSNAAPADNGASMPSARHAAEHSHTLRHARGGPVVVRVCSDSAEHATVTISDGNESRSCAPFAAPSAIDLPVRLIAGIARVVALPLEWPGAGIPTGGTDRPIQCTPSMSPGRGKWSASVSGDEIAARADDAARAIETAIQSFTSTISGAGGSSPLSDSILQTWSCSVAHVIASCIPAGMLPASSYVIEVDALRGWTAIPGASDSARYTAIGNAMAVPCVRWIGERILQARGGEPFRYLSVCSGIEALTLAWAPLGCEPVLVSEIARFPRRVLEVRLGARPLSGT